jgi:glycolate oxidase FAD binding subunit
MILPTTAEELAAELEAAQAAGKTIALTGHGTKHCMGGPLAASDVEISTSRLNRVLQYEPSDLTISVQAGITYGELSRVLAEHRQMVPLDPPFSENATVGGIVASNSSGPRRRLYGTARDMVIGMTFATLEGKLIQTGAMVVKSVAGLDMGKLMIGSFGTLAAIASVNFKLHPMPTATRTFVRKFDKVADAIAARDAILKSVLQPAAIDLLKLREGAEMYVQAGGNPAVLDRYSRELSGSDVLEGEQEQKFWSNIREFTPSMLAAHPDLAVVRIACTLSEVGKTLESLPAPALARAGSGICYGYFADPQEALGRGVVEFAPQKTRETAALWAPPENDFAMMKKIKQMFDPRQLLNRGRLYGSI